MKYKIYQEEYHGTSQTKMIVSTYSFLFVVNCSLENSNLHWPQGDKSEKKLSGGTIYLVKTRLYTKS